VTLRAGNAAGRRSLKDHGADSQAPTGRTQKSTPHGFSIEGRSGSVHFFRKLFPQDAVPNKLTSVGTFAPVETGTTTGAFGGHAEAERLAKLEERLARMKAKVQAAPDVLVDPQGVAAPPARTKADVKHTRSANARR